MSDTVAQEDTNSVGGLLRRARRARGWTQEMLSDESGISQTCISEIESGIITNPGTKTVIRLAQALDVGASALVPGWI